MQRLRGVASRRAVLIALVAAVVAFAGCFVIARSVSGDDDANRAMPARKVPDRLVTISNLERAPTIKPLRSAAGGPP